MVYVGVLQGNQLAKSDKKLFLMTMSIEAKTATLRILKLIVKF
jgi:hypothetical protein